jgi:hypothetical protein
VNVMGALFVAGGAFEAALLLASMVFGWKWGPYRPGPGAFIALVAVGVAAAAATVLIGRAMMRIDNQRLSIIEAPPTTGTRPVESRAGLALSVGIFSVVLVYPFGILLGPAAFLVGLSAVRRINRAPGTLAGSGRARTGAIIGAVVSGMYLFWILVDVVAIFAFGSAIPAAN